MTEPPNRRPTRRLSITKPQRQSAAGADLIALCQTVTEDGTLQPQEVAALERWLDDHGSTDLPAREYLFHAVKKIVADGRVSREEAWELYQAIETILPPDVRELVHSKRRAVERNAVHQALIEHEERDRNEPIGSWNFMVAGVRYEGRPLAIVRYAHPDDVAYLIRDRQNRFSRNAVAIRLSNGMQIGFVPEDDASELAPLLDHGSPQRAYITKILTGGHSPIPVVQAYLYGEDATEPGLVREKDVPAKVPPPTSIGSTGIAIVIVLAAVIMLYFVIR